MIFIFIHTMRSILCSFSGIFGKDLLSSGSRLANPSVCLCTQSFYRDNSRHIQRILDVKTQIQRPDR